MLWLKAFHIVFVVTWFAGLLYLPRLFVYHRQIGADEALASARSSTMQRRLLAITTVGGVLALAFGLALLFWWMGQAPGYAKQGWLHAKLALVALLIAFHVHCAVLVRRLAAGTARMRIGALKWFNEIPALILVAIVVLVVVKPF